jgi:iron complex outermembrane receptor protein
MRNKLKPSLGGGSSTFMLVMLGCSTQTLAQSVPSDKSQTDAVSLAEIIVTAQKRSERLQDVPMSITAATSDQLKSLGVTSADDLAKLVPDFSAQKSAYGLPVYFIRGVGFFDTTLGVSPAVTVYTDQIPLPFAPMSRGAVLDLERVEVLKGPQGTLFGENSTGGAVNFIAAKPTATREAGVEVTYGRFNQFDTEGYISGPIGETLSARLAVRHEDRGDWQTGYTTPQQLGKKDFTDGRLIVDWKPGDTLRFEFQATGWKDTSDTQQPQFIEYAAIQPVGGRPESYQLSSFPAAPLDARAAAWGPQSDFSRDDNLYQFSLRADADITNDIELTSLTSYAKFNTSVPIDIDASVYPVDFVTTTGNIKSFSQELRLSGSVGERTQWMIGGNYQYDTVDELWLLGPPLSDSGDHAGPFNFNSANVQNDQTIKTESGFGSLNFDITKTLTAQGSVRYTSQQRHFSGCTRDSGDGTLIAAVNFLSGSSRQPGDCASFDHVGLVENNLNEDNVAWRGGLNWKLTSAALLYANVTKGYKAGGFPTLPAIVAEQYNGVSQESVLAYEAGFKLSPLDRRLTVDGAAFYYDYRGKQLVGYQVVPFFGPIPGLVSIPRSKVQGAELTVTMAPIEALRITAGGTFVESKVLTNPINPTGPFGDIGSFAGQAFPFTPKWQGVVDAEYHVPVSATKHIYVGASAAARSSTYSTLLSGLASASSQEQLLRTPGYAVADLRAGLETDDGAWRVEVWGRNVTNKYYGITKSRTSDVVYGFAGMPATYGITLRYSYGR